MQPDSLFYQVLHEAQLMCGVLFDLNKTTEDALMEASRLVAKRLRYEAGEEEA